MRINLLGTIQTQHIDQYRSLLILEEGLVRVLRIYAVVWYHSGSELAAHRVTRQAKHLHLNVSPHPTVS